MTEFNRKTNEADGLAFLGLHEDAWEVLESLPPLLKLRPEVLRVRLMICAGLERWEMGREIAKLASPDSPPAFKEEAGRFYLAHAKALRAADDLPAARRALTDLAFVWPEGRGLVIDSEDLKAIW